MCEKIKPFTLAIDPGTTESAFCILRSSDQKPLYFEKLKNELLISHVEKFFAEKYPQVLWLADSIDLVIERMQGNNFSVGATTFETCEWIGEFRTMFREKFGCICHYVYRRDEYKALCGNLYTKNDTGIRQALVDMYAMGEPNFGKGTKKEPGWFYGFKQDTWAAYSVGITYLIVEFKW